MQYEKQNFKDGLTLFASQLNHIEDGIKALYDEITDIGVAASGDPSLSPSVALETALQAINSAIEELRFLLEHSPTSRIDSVTIYASAWEGTDNLHSQVVNINGITEYSKVDLLPSVEQLAIFQNKNVAFVTENEDGVVTVFAIGDKPTLDYTMQVQITEVEA